MKNYDSKSTDIVYPSMDCSKCKEKNSIEVIGEYIDGNEVTTTFNCVNCNFSWREKTLL